MYIVFQMSNVIRYEMSLIIKALGTPGIKDALKRHLKGMLDNGAHLFNVENLGLRRLPNVFHVQGERQYEGHYFLINFNAPHDSLNQIRKMARKDSDIIKCFAALKDDGWVPPCSLPNAANCEFGEIRNPNYEKTARRRHGYRLY
ncbi:unnamed protein product [Schistosoma bovis]|uniref:Small ribosomal subunit protein bS6m n=5 Tax=Schistosoma TaxID=6181 RepID=A0AA85AUX4_9TREM|nr:unnamed protein product [Schistosoma intercalatum]CAH8625974.1 unnamed protein product [Schistosoma mattheei]CAH8656151.1 unnamed protein product [Schistosoma bovis]CAH8668434.1 unnamed protein product [Schistosoma haematobium]CAH8635306.1 unnamed protein product [Schistosoma intercalatum]